MKNQHNEYEGWVNRRVREWLKDVRNAPKGRRRNRLNDAAFAWAGLIEHRLATEENIAARLLEATGLPEKEARDTIERAIREGRGKPLDLPNIQTRPDHQVRKHGQEQARQAKEKEDREKQAKRDWFLNEVWGPARPVTQTPALGYYEETRGLKGACLDDLHFLPELKYSQKEEPTSFWPAIVIPVRQAPDSPVQGGFVLYLSEDCRHKAPKDRVSTPRKARTSFTGLGYWTGNRDSDTLIICEGVENALSLSLMRHDSPLICAAMSSVNMANITPPPGIKRVVLAGDNDESGQKANDGAGRNLLKQGYRVTVIKTPEGPKGQKAPDWNDLLLMADDRPDHANHANEEAGYIPPDAPDMSVLDAEQVIAPAFPLDIFPDHQAEWIRLKAAGKAAPVDYVAASLLAAAAGLTGTSRQVQAWEGYRQYAILWLVIIGNPSSRKSPAMEDILNMLGQIDRDFAHEHTEACKRLEKKIIEARKEKEDWEKAVAAGENAAHMPPEIPSRPKQKRIYTDNFTQEALEQIQADNPKGVVCLKDELTGFLGQMGRYSGARDADKAYYLSCYDGKKVISDKIKYEGRPLRIEKAALSIIGGIQPDRLHLLTSGDDDGFAARFLPLAPPKTLFTGGPDPDDEPDDALMLDVLRILSRYEHDENGNPVVMLLDDEAVTVFRDWMVRHDRKTGNLSGKLGSFASKQPGQVLRLALVLECLKGALNTSLYDDKEPEIVSLDSLNGAIRLIDEYFMPAIRNMLGGLSLAPDMAGARAIAQRIVRDRPNRINSTEIRCKWRIEGLKTAKDVKGAVQVLIDAGWLDWADPDTTKGAARKKEWTVNPLVFPLYDDANAPNALQNSNIAFQPESGRVGTKTPDQENVPTRSDCSDPKRDNFAKPSENPPDAASLEMPEEI